jgi:hypothetical protein
MTGTETNSTVASVCCGYAVRTFTNGAVVCEFCAQRCETEPAPEGGAPMIDDEEVVA